MGTLWLRGDRGVDLPEILHILALPEFSSLFCPNLGGKLPPCPPDSYTRVWRHWHKIL